MGLGGGGAEGGVFIALPIPPLRLRGLSLALALRCASARFCSSACLAIAVQVLSIIVRNKPSCASAMSKLLRGVVG